MLCGFGVDYDQNTNFSNPILTPQAPNGYGFGKLRSNYALLTMPIGMSRQVSEHLSAGISVVPAFSMLKVIPSPFATPVTAGSTVPYYLSASKNAPGHLAWAHRPASSISSTASSVRASHTTLLSGFATSNGKPPTLPERNMQWNVR